MREKEKENEAAASVVYFTSLPSAHDLALDKDFFNLKYSLPSALDLTLGKDVFAECRLTSTRQRSDVGFSNFFAECQPADTRQRLLCRVSSLDTRQSTFFSTKLFVVCFYTM